MNLHYAFRPETALAVTGLLLAAGPLSADERALTRTEVAGQFSLVLPEGWSVYDQSAVVLGRSGPGGVIIFSAEPLTAPGATTADLAVLARVDRGDLPSFIVDRQKAERGMACAKLSRTAIYNIGEKLKKDPAFSATQRHFAVLAPRHEDIQLGGCHGVKFVLEANKGNPAKHWVIDVRAVSDGQVLYLFGLRNRADYHAENLGAFEAALATLNFP
jgi:hypothetical protein